MVVNFFLHKFYKIFKSYFKFTLLINMNTGSAEKKGKISVKSKKKICELFWRFSIWSSKSTSNGFTVYFTVYLIPHRPNKIYNCLIVALNESHHRLVYKGPPLVCSLGLMLDTFKFDIRKHSQFDQNLVNKWANEHKKFY